MLVMENIQASEQIYLDSNGLLLFDEELTTNQSPDRKLESVLLCDDMEWLEEELEAMHNAQKNI